MSVERLAAALAGAAIVAGLILLALGLYGTTEPVAPSRLRLTARRVLAGRGGSGASVSKRARTAAISLVVGAGVWLLSGWPVAAIVAGLAVPGLPYFFAAGKVAARRIQAMEALEEWVRRLADAMAAGGAPVQTLVTSADHPPAPIAGPVRALAARLATPRIDKRTALRLFAADIDDPLGDMVALALEIAVTKATAKVPDVLRTLAAQVADEVADRRAAETERAQPRNEARTIVIVQIVFVIAVCAATTYTAPYGTAAGQLILAALAAVVIGALWMLRRLSMPDNPPRILDSPPAGPAGAVRGAR